MNTFEVAFKSDELPFIHYNLKNKNTTSEIINIENADCGNLVMLETYNGVSAYLINKLDNSYSYPSPKGLMNIKFNHLLTF